MMMKMYLVAFSFMVVAFVLPVPASAAEVHVYTWPAAGTFGNDTASTLYLRPLNNAASGITSFGQGYPVGNSAGIAYVPEPSGILRANSYLQSSGWYAREAERRAAHQEKEALLRRIAELERKIMELEALVVRLNQSPAAAGTR